MNPCESTFARLHSVEYELLYLAVPLGHSTIPEKEVAGRDLLRYCLLRALHMVPEEARAAMGAYSIAPGSLTLVNIRTDGSTKVARRDRAETGLQEHSV